MADFQIALMDDGTYYYEGGVIIAFSAYATIFPTGDDLGVTIQDGERSITLKGEYPLFAELHTVTPGNLPRPARMFGTGDVIKQSVIGSKIKSIKKIKE